jgi:hypothetical protein
MDSLNTTGVLLLLVLVRNCTNLEWPAKIRMVFRAPTPVGLVPFLFDQSYNSRPTGRLGGTGWTTCCQTIQHPARAGEHMLLERISSGRFEQPIAYLRAATVRGHERLRDQVTMTHPFELELKIC